MFARAESSNLPTRFSFAMTCRSRTSAGAYSNIASSNVKRVSDGSHCKLPIANCKLKIAGIAELFDKLPACREGLPTLNLQFAFCNLHFAITDSLFRFILRFQKLLCSLGSFHHR